MTTESENSVFDNNIEEMFDVICNLEITDYDVYDCEEIDLDKIKIQLNLMGFSEYLSDRQLFVYLCGWLNLYELKTRNASGIPSIELFKKRPQFLKVAHLVKRLCKSNVDFVEIASTMLGEDSGHYHMESLKRDILDYYLKNQIPTADVHF